MIKGLLALPPTVIAFTIAASGCFLAVTAEADKVRQPSLISEYRAACDRVESTVTSENYQNASVEQQRKQLQKSLFQGIQRQEVETAFRVLSDLDPSARYRVLKDGVEEQTGEEWHCPELARVVSLTND